MINKKILVAVVALGCLLMITGCALAGFDFGALFADKAEYTTVRQTENLGATDTISIDVDTETVRLGLSQDELAHIVYTDSDKEKHLYTYADGVLSLAVDRAERKWYGYINFSFSATERVIEVLLPSTFSGKIEVNCSTGAINAADLPSLSSLELTLTTGDITVSNCEAANARFAATTGRLNLSKLRGGAFYAECTTGKVNVDGLASDAVTIRSASGDIALANATCDSISASGTTSSIRLEQIEAREIELCVTTGDITGSIACDPTEFTIDASTVTGDNNLGAVHFGGERKLNVNTTTGNIEISFGE